METLLSDLRLGMRMLLKAPAFTAVSVLALALGIGANSVMFSVASTVLLRPLSYPDAEQIMWIKTVQRDTGSEIGSSPPDFYRVREANRGFTAVAALYRKPVNVTGAQEPQRVGAIVASSDLFRVLGIVPALGRGFALDDERWGSHRVALVSSGMWRSRFGGDPGVIGRTLTVDGQPCTVVGVLPAGFTWLGSETELLLPMSFEPGDNLNSHYNYFIGMVGRLRPGVTVEQGQSEIAAIGQGIADEFPESRKLKLDVEPLEKSMVGDLRPAIAVLLGAVAFVLLIACANLANLMLVRAAARQREIAIRAALGASRARILRQLLTESVLLAMLGGLAGLLLASWSTAAVNGLGQEVLPRMRDVKVDGSVLTFTLAASLISGILFGIAPALHGSAVHLRDSLNETSAAAPPGRRRLTSALVVAEVALAMVLLAGAGLLVKSTYRLLHVDPGFDPRGVLTAEVSLPRHKYVDPRLVRPSSLAAATARATAFFDELIAGVRTLPGVRAAGAGARLPLGGNSWGRRLVLWDRPLPAHADELPEIEYQVVAGDYFRALGIRVRGRAFDQRSARARSSRDGAARLPPTAVHHRRRRGRRPYRRARSGAGAARLRSLCAGG